MKINMNKFVKGSEDYVDTTGGVVAYVEDPVVEPKKKRATRKKNNSDTAKDPATTIIPVAQTSLSYVQENIPYAQAYADTNRQLDETIAQLNILGSEAMNDLQTVRANKTMRNKFNIANDLSMTVSSILQAKLTAIREKNNTIRDINKMELDRLKQLKASASEEDDATRIANMYSAFVNTPIGMGREALAPNMQDILTGAASGSPIPMASLGNDQQMWESNLDPSQNRMLLDAKGLIETVVMYDANTGNRWFEVIDKQTRQPVANVEKPDSSYIYDLDLNVRGGFAKDSNRNTIYPLICVNGDQSITEY